MKRIKDKWPVYLVNTLGLLALGYFLFILLFMFRFTTSTGISDSTNSHQGRVYSYEEDPDSVYKRSIEQLPYREYNDRRIVSTLLRSAIRFLTSPGSPGRLLV